MDLNADGHIDILSGSYSRMGADMAGLFQVLYGNAEGGFAPPKVLEGNDGEPLILDLPAGEHGDDDLGRICTRAWAVDLDGDGKLDLVSGNFGGTFGWFRGLGEGRFEPKSRLLMDTDGDPLQVEMHSDPTFADWDGDGDLDLISGASSGGVFLFPREGSAEEPRFGKRVTLVEGSADPYGLNQADAVTFGTDHLKAPGSSTRVAVADVDGDGKLDLLVGDNCSYMLVKPGVSETEARKRLVAWKAKQAELFASMPKVDYESMSEEDEAALETFYEALSAHEEEKAKFVDERRTGFVWLYRRK